jgi:hypothetical protein
MRKFFVLVTTFILCFGLVGGFGDSTRNNGSLIPISSAAQNPDLDFVIVNKTFY